VGLWKYLFVLFQKDNQKVYQRKNVMEKQLKIIKFQMVKHMIGKVGYGMERRKCE
jgi:hypothetical protein